jgi:hypothetical protein
MHDRKRALGALGQKWEREDCELVAAMTDVFSARKMGT